VYTDCVIVCGPLRGRAPRFAALATCALVLAGACVSEPAKAPVKPADVQAGDVRAFVVTEAGAGRAIGDVALTGPQLEIGVHAQGRVDERDQVTALRQPEGAPSASASNHRDHDWEALHALLEIDGALFEPTVSRVAVERIAGKPSITIEGYVELPGDDAGVATPARGASLAGLPKLRLQLKRWLRLADIGSALRITTSVRVLRGKVPATLRVVERVAWGGGSPLAPFVGELRAGVAIEADWVARSIEGRSVVVGAPAGLVRVIGHNVDHARKDLLRYTDVYLETQRVEPARKARSRATEPPRFDAELLLSASHGGLARAVRQLGWARGKPFVEAVAMLTTNPPSTEVQVVDAKTGVLAIAGIPDDKRRVILPLPSDALDRALLVGARAGGIEASEWLPLKEAGQAPPYATILLAVPASSVLHIRVRHAATGEPLPARIRLLPRKNSAVPSLGPDWKASGALDTVISASGSTELRLSPGYYRLIATHGPEWSVADEPIELAVGKNAEIDLELERAIDPGPWVACELHVHADPSSDSQVSLDDRVASLVAEGIAFAVPTDHNHVTDLSAAIAAQPLWGLFTVPGVEVTTDAPNFGHFNAYPYPVDTTLPANGAPEYRGWRPGDMFAALHAIGPDVVVQVNHPRIEGGIGYFEKAEYDSKLDRGGELWSAEFDALEVWNGFDLARWENVEQVLGDWLAMLEHGHRIVATGSSDSHTIRSEGAGYPRTYVRADLAGVGHGVDLVRSLRRGRAFVTSGPFLSVQLGDKTLGDAVEVRPGEPIELEVSVQVPHWMQVTTLRVYLGTAVIRELALGAPASSSAIGRRYRRTLRLSIDKPGPLVVAVEGDATLEPVVARRGVKPFAFTNPIWLVRPGEAPPQVRSYATPSLEPVPHGHSHPHPPDGSAPLAVPPISANQGQVDLNLNQGQVDLDLDLNQGEVSPSEGGVRDAAPPHMH